MSDKSQTKLQNLKMTGERLSREKEKQLKQSGQMVVKRKFGWMYAPDNLEKWLEKMEELGFNLYRIGNGGTAFYFIQYSPRKVRYCADFQSLSNESYFDFHREAGWNHIYSSYSSFQKWTIWSREFADGEKSYQLKHARRVAIIYTMMFLPLVALYIFMGVFLNNLPKMNIAIYLLCIFVFGSYIVRLWLYYIRLRKQNDFRSP